MSLKPLAILLAAGMLLNSAHADDPWNLTPDVRARCLSVLTDGMRGSDFWPAMHAAEGLTAAGMGREVHQHLAPKLDTEQDDQRRCGIARELVRAGSLQHGNVLMEILKSEDKHGHVHAAESLFKVGWSGDSKPLEAALSEDREIRLRIMAAAALARHGDETTKARSLVFLRKSLHDEDDPGIFRLAAWVLGRVGDQQDIEGIRSRMEDAESDPLVFAFLEHALAALGDPQGKKALIENFDSDAPSIRTYAAVFAGETGMVEAAPALVKQLDDDQLDARIRAAHALILLDN